MIHAINRHYIPAFLPNGTL